MISSGLASAGVASITGYQEVLDRTTMTHGSDGQKLPTTGFSGVTITFGSLASSGFRSSTIERVSTAFSNLTVSLSGNRPQNYFDRVECVLGTFDQTAASWSYNSTLDSTTWGWTSGSFASSGTSTLDIIYLE